MEFVVTGPLSFVNEKISQMDPFTTIVFNIGQQ